MNNYLKRRAAAKSYPLIYFAAAKLGADVSMIGCVGDDDNGNALIKNLQSAGVNTQGIQMHKDVLTGNAFITVNRDGENSIIVIPGANAALTKEHLDSYMKLMDDCDAILVQLEIPLQVVRHVAKSAKSKGKLVVLDPAPAVCELPEELIQSVDILKPNETELQILTGMKTDATQDIVQAARMLIKKGIKNIVVTIGSKGTVWVTEKDYKVFPPRKVDAIDTTAAGDAFTAAFASKVTQGCSYGEAIEYANIVSSIVVTRKGAQSSIPGYDEVEKILGSG